MGELYIWTLFRNSETEKQNHTFFGIKDRLLFQQFAVSLIKFQQYAFEHSSIFSEQVEILACLIEIID